MAWLSVIELLSKNCSVLSNTEASSAFSHAMSCLKVNSGALRLLDVVVCLFVFQRHDAL